MMYEECLKKQRSQSYSCKTRNLVVFQCACFGFNSQYQFVQFENSTALAENFPAWTNEDGPMHENVLLDVNSGENADRMNLKHLFAYCQIKNVLFLECHSAKNQGNGLVDCYCTNNSEDTQSSYYKFKTRDVWSGPRLSTTTKPSLIFRREHVHIPLPPSNTATTKSSNALNVIYIFIIIIFLSAIIMLLRYCKCLKKNFYQLTWSCKKIDPENNDEL